MDEPKVDGFLMTAIFGDNDLGLDDTSNPDAVLFDPFQKFFEQAEIDHAFAAAADRGSVSTDFLKTSGIETDVDSEEFALDSPPTLAKAEPGSSRATFAKRMGIVRVEAKEIDGVRWQDCFNAGGELVYMRFIGRA